MTEDATKLYGAEHVRRYRETGGEVGHIWKEGSTILLLTTKGRTSGEPRTAPLIYAEDGDRYVIIASQGGAPEHPGLVPQPREGSRTSSCKCWTRCSPRHARTAEGDERDRLWEKANEVWPHYAEYQLRTDRVIPVVVLERAA